MPNKSEVLPLPRPSDAAVEQAVRQELHRDRQTAGLPVSVDVFDRIVFVQGRVPSPEGVGKIEEVVQRVDDVAEVIDELDVG